MSTTRTSTFNSPPRTRTRPTSSSQQTPRKKNAPRTEIWTSLLRQTREAQARSRTQSVQNRDLILCGGSPEDQQTLVKRYVARPPPQQRGRDSREEKRKGEVRLSTRFGYGYGFVNLFSPPHGGGVGGGGLLGGEAEEAAKVEVHTVMEAEVGYESTLRRLFSVRRESRDDEDTGVGGGGEHEGRRAAVCILLSWKEPWNFLMQLQRWLHMISRSLLEPGAPKDENSLEVIKEHKLSLTVVLQHVESQEILERESFTEETFDYISQTLRTCILPLSAALVYTASAAPPQPAGAPLSDIQKVLYTSLGIDVTTLQAKDVEKEDMQPRHNVVDRMAIIVPAGWDSVGKIRLLSETFSPEAVIEGWVVDLSIPVFTELSQLPQREGEDPSSERANGTLEDTTAGAQPAEVYISTPTRSNTHTGTLQSPLATSPHPSPPPSPSKMPRSAITPYENQIQDPNAHKAPKPPTIEVTTKPNQLFLSEMKSALQQYEQADAERLRKNPNVVSTTAGALTRGSSSEASGGALSELGDVAFNVGGVSYNTVSAEAAIERLKRPTHPSSSSGGGTESPSVSTPRTGTPRPPRRDGASSESKETPAGAGGKGEIDKLEEYFASLMKRGGGGGERSNSSTPSKAPTQQ